LPDVSISHTARAVVAALSEPAAQIGIDLADFKQVRSVEALKRAFSDRELDLLGAAPRETKRRVLSFWCAKEAASKAHSSGLGGEPRDWLIDDYAAASGLVTVNRYAVNI
jgi:phosphopantetheinyl transferase